VLLEPSASETKEVRRSEKSVVVTISTRARDRHGDIVDPAGVRLDRFRKNPVVLYSHDYGGLPVAKSLWERLRKDEGGRMPAAQARARRGKDEAGSGSSSPLSLIAKPQFHLQTELSREVWALVVKGVLSAWSIGFIPEDWEPQPKGKGFRVKRWDLLEYSCVPVPANFQALTHELKERRITAPALVKSLAPLGFETPDLVEHDVRNGNISPQSPPAAGETRSLPAGRRDTENDHGNTGGTTCRSPAARSRLRGRPRLCVSSEAGGGCSVVDVQAAVRRAFERVLARARGEGFV
jgi:hypothetical protein